MLLSIDWNTNLNDLTSDGHHLIVATELSRAQTRAVEDDLVAHEVTQVRHFAPLHHAARRAEPGESGKYIYTANHVITKSSF